MMPPMDGGVGWTLGPMLGLLVGIGLLAGTVALGLRYSRRSASHTREKVSAFNAVMARLGSRTDLSFQSFPDYVHPLIGEVPCFGRLTGPWEEWSIRVDVESRRGGGGGALTRVRVTVFAPPGRPFDRRARDEVRRALKAHRCALAELSEESLVALGPAAGGWGPYQQWHGLPEDEGGLTAILDRATEAARSALR